jgi:hypothetical protein
MDITPYVENLRRDLAAAAEAGGPEIAQAAERLTLALDSSARLALMEAISQAASEITTEMPAGGVDVRLNGRELDFVVHHTPVDSATPAAPAPTPDEIEEEGGLARVTLRIPESVKAKAEELAARSGHSLNTWLVQVVRAATREGAINVDIDLSSIPFFGGNDPFGGKGRGNKRMTGWV